MSRSPLAAPAVARLEASGSVAPVLGRAGGCAVAARLPTPDSNGAEHALQAVVLWLQLATEAAGAAAVLAGLAATAAVYARGIAGDGPARYAAVRLTLARHLALALEFQLATDVLATAITPSWNQIGQLGAIAAIRTLLEFLPGTGDARGAGGAGSRRPPRPGAA